MGRKKKIKPEPKPGSGNDPVPEKNLYLWLNDWAGPRLNRIFWICFFLSILLGLFFFDPKVSLGGDDSMYINRAFNFIHQGKFPTFQGPLYPMLLGVIIYFSGLNLILLKSLSLLFMAGHLWFYYKAFKRHLSPFLMATMLIILSTNYSLLYMSSTTYTEPLYLFLQSLFIYLFDRYIISPGPVTRPAGRFAGRMVLLAGLAFIMSITRSVGLTVPIAAVVFLTLEAFLRGKKQSYLIAAGTMVVAFLVFHYSFQLMKKEIWNVTTAQTSGQMEKLFYKNYYNEQAGKEDFSGYVKRLTGNSASYLGYHFYSIFGMSFGDKPSASWPAILVYIMLLTGFVITLKKDPFWTWILLYLGAALGVTFILLQVFWTQERLVLVYAPLILAAFLHTIHLVFYEHTGKLKFITVLVPFIFILANTGKTVSRIPETVTSIRHYLKGEMLYGFTQDWINYLDMARWSAENLPEDAYVACRKPGMAFIYSGGKEFYGIWRVPSDDPEELYQKLKKAGVTHVIMAHLLVNPEKSQTRTINTVRRYLTRINQAYPGKLRLVHKIGNKWPAYLYELH